MAKKENRYVQFYTAGSAAAKVQIQDEQTWAPLPAPKPKKKVAIFVDPVAILGVAVAVCMLILMAVGINQMNTERRKVAALERYVAQLTAENHTLRETYTAGYNLDSIEREALKLGMIPEEAVQRTQIHVTMPPAEDEGKADLWSRMTSYLTSLFA